jgi:molybdopterin/thiamine biosynthesis adenylyltransferase
MALFASRAGQGTHGSVRRAIINDNRSLWAQELSELPADVTSRLPAEELWAWAVYPWLRAAVAVPSEQTLYDVLTSRNYPIVSRQEQQLLHNSHVIVIGLSTGRAVAQQVARIGVGSIHLADADHLAPSNTNRLVGTRLTDMGITKVASTARELLEYNPYLKVTSQASFIDGGALDAHLRNHKTAVVIEMIDSFPAKVQIRRASRAHGVPVVMPTDMDWDPMVDVDFPDAPMFGGRLSDADIAAVESPTTGFAEKTEIAMRFMALPHWAPRSFLSGQLARHGLVPFWSQTIPAVSVGAAAAARAVFDIVRGARSPVDRVVLSIRDGYGTKDPLDEGETLFKQLMEAAPDTQFPTA